MAEGRAQRIAESRARDAAFFRSLAARRTCFGWGDAEGATPWEIAEETPCDDPWEGAVMVPLWPGEAAAQAENSGDVEPGETPLEMRLEDLPARLRRWKDLEIDIAVHPVGGRIACVHSVEEFARRVLDAVGGATEDPAAPRWMAELAALHRVLP
jgi:hypothetical protein